MSLRKTLIALLACGAAAVAGLGLQVAPASAGTVRIEYSKNGVVYGRETITTSGTSVQSAGAPSMAGMGGTADVTVISGAVVSTSASTATEDNGFRRQTGEHVTFNVIPGQKLAFVDSTDGPSFGGGGGGGGGGGDASAANQATQITAANLTNTNIGAVSGSPAANTLQARLATLHTDLATLNTTMGAAPMQQTGGSVSITGSLPAFASPPSVTVGGTLPAFASPPSVTVGGTLPAFASTPTVKPTGLDGSTVASAANPNPTADSGVLDAAVTNATVSSATTVVSVNSAGYGSVIFQMTSAGTGNTVTFQASNDGGTTLVAVTCNPIGGTGSTTPVSTATATGMWECPAVGAIMRATVTTYSSGNVTIYAMGKRFSTFRMAANVANTVNVTPRAGTSNGCSTGKVISAATTNATSLKASAGLVCGYEFCGTTANVRYVHIYAKATAPTVGTDTPLRTIAVPANSCTSYPTAVGLTVSTGIAYSITANPADNDNTAVGANDVVGSIDYN